MEGSDYIKNTKTRLVLLGTLFFIIMNISGIYALTNQTTTGSLSTGVVDIKLQTYKLNNGIEEIFDNKDVNPGEVVSYIPKIENLGENCYIRVKIKYIDDNTDFYNYVTNFLNGFNKYGEYYYYNKALKPNETIKLFDTIKIPENISNSYGKSELPISILVEAVQEKNFEPDFSNEDPWGGIVPQKRIDNTINNTNKNNSKITIKYENGSESNITVPNNFLEHIAKVMPGDSFQEYVDINNDKKDAKYYLQIRVDEKYLVEKDLLAKIKLQIKNIKGKVIFDGNMDSTGRVLLGSYEPNDSDRLEFNVFVPNDIGNEYTLLNPVLDIVFLVEYDGMQIPSSNGLVQNVLSNPKTGDKIDWAITMFLISSICLMITIILGYIEKKKENIDSIN